MSRHSPGEGSIYQRQDGLWCGSIQVGGRKRVVYGKIRQDVVRKLDKVKEGIVGNNLPDPGKRTLNDLLDAWLSQVSTTLKPRTIADYTAICRRDIRPHLGHLRLSKLSPHHVQNLYSKLGQGGSRSPSHAHAVLHRACRVAVLWGWIAENPCERVLKPSYKPKRKTIWTEDELQRFLGGTRDNWLHPVWMVAVATGCRLGELLALRWDDIDLPGASVSIDRNVQRIDREWVYSAPKTEAGERRISLPAEAVTAFKRQRVQQASWKLKIGQSWPAHGLVFCRPSGLMLDHATVEKGMKQEVGRLGLPSLTPHGLRHLAASLLLSRGMPVTVVSARLGHASPNITMTIYAHALKDQDQQAALVMQEMLG